MPSVDDVAVDVILPCLDERDALARRLGARVVEAAARGYGSACRAGLSASTAEVVVRAYRDTAAALR